MDDLIIADTGPLIMAAHMEIFPTLHALFPNLCLTQSVFQECCKEPFLPGAQEIQKAIKQKFLKILPDPEVAENDPLLLLGRGESSAIRLALQQKGKLWMDDALGPKYAQRYGLKIIGTLGILLLLKKHKKIDAVYPLIQILQSHGYYLSSALINTVLEMAKENVS